MKRIFVVAAIISVVWGHTPAWAQLLPRFNPGDVLHAVDLNDIVDHILGVGTPQTINVDCGAGGTIGQALQQATGGDTIKVIGTCHEAVSITKFGITLDGQGQTIIDATGLQQSALTIDGAHSVTIKGLTVQHGDPHGLLARRGAAVILMGVTAQDNITEGISIDENSTAQLTDCTAQRNGRDGIRTFRNGSATLNGTIVSQNNQRHGIEALAGSVVFINIGAMVTVSGNTDNGISVSQTSQLTMSPASSGTATLVAQDNGDNGIEVSQNGALGIFGGTVTVQNNAGGGVEALRTSSIVFQGSTERAPLVVQILNNQGHGVELDQNSSARLDGSEGGTTIEIHGNMSNGLAVFSDSHLKMDDVIVRNNQSNGIHVDLSTANLTNVQLLDHTNASGLLLGAGSRVSANNLTVTGNSNSSIFSPGINVNDKSSLTLSNSTVSGNLGTGGGINLFNGSAANLSSTTISGNPGGSGLNLSQGASANLNTVTIRDHTTANVWALQLGGGSSASVNNSTITNNAGGGINLFNGSTLSMSNSTVSNNQGTLFGGGLSLFDNCSASLNTVGISGHTNANTVVHIGLNSTVLANSLTVTNNGHQGIFVGETSGFVSDTGLMVTSNSGGGISVDESHIRLQNATITGNGGTGGADLSASFGARLNLNTGNTIGTITCDTTVLSRGNTVCPSS